MLPQRATLVPRALVAHQAGEKIKQMVHVRYDLAETAVRVSLTP